MAHYQTELDIEGMTCNHCIRAVQGALEQGWCFDFEGVKLRTRLFAGTFSDCLIAAGVF